jgi:hypothetical protein
MYKGVCDFVGKTYKEKSLVTLLSLSLGDTYGLIFKPLCLVAYRIRQRCLVIAKVKQGDLLTSKLKRKFPI